MNAERETDYLVVGAGAMGMAFADELLTQRPSARVALVDRHARPGGHWNDAYSFVSLHQPAAYYGVNSLALGRGGSALASGREVLSYYEEVLRRLLSTGRLDYFPLCEHRGGGVVQSLVERKSKEGQYKCGHKLETVDTLKDLIGLKSSGKIKSRLQKSQKSGPHLL